MILDKWISFETKDPEIDERILIVVETHMPFTATGIHYHYWISSGRLTEDNGLIIEALTGVRQIDPDDPELGDIAITNRPVLWRPMIALPFEEDHKEKLDFKGE
jgi:hypothetical protein